MDSKSQESSLENVDNNKSQENKLQIVEKNKGNIVEEVKSRAIVKYSTVNLPTDFALLQCNTNLNLPPSNWLTSYAESYGLHHAVASSTGFSSFKMAHMFPDNITEVDVVSDAENIKKLLKIPYSRNPVSMMVHCIEKTLLIDEFDVHKHLLRTSESEWAWLRKFFFEHILETLSGKKLSDTAKNSRHALQEKSLVSKFLHYSLTESDHDEKPPTEHPPFRDSLTKMWPPLPEPKPEEHLPDSSKKQTFNHNVVWTFEDIQMLLGTNMPIFGGPTHPCISLRLRDTNKPISVLTGIDYWLDNLMCNVPEVLMCYHLDGIVQRYELVKTEDLPHLPDSKFSPNLVRGVAQNILSFLKSNATKAGHTYWLFKGKDEDVVKLYDLTSLCSESLIDQGQNLFTVPVAMLLYRVARNMKHSLDPSAMKPGTIRALLNNCLVLLQKEKYPQIVTSAHYMLSDLYLPLGVNHESVQDEEERVSPEPPDHNTSLINTLSISDDMEPLSLPPYERPPLLVGSVTERCNQALQHVVEGLQCLQFFDNFNTDTEKSDEIQNEDQPEPRMAHPHQPIPMPYCSLSPETAKVTSKTRKELQKTSPVVNSKKKNKNKKRKGPERTIKSGQTEVHSNHMSKKVANSVEEFPVYFWNSAEKSLLQKLQSVRLPTWQAPNPSDTVSWKGHLKTLLYGKACLVYNTLADTELAAKRYGASLRCVSLALRCHAHMASGCGPCVSLVSSVLSLAGDNCFHLTKEIDKIESHQSDYAKYNETDNALQAEMELDMPRGAYPYECKILPERLESVDQLLLSSLTCYKQAQLLKPCDALHSRIGNVHNELGTSYMTTIKELDTSKMDEDLAKDEVDSLLMRSEQHLEQGLAEFDKVNDKYNKALVLANTGRLIRMKTMYLSHFNEKTQYVHWDEALAQYDKALNVLGSRKAGTPIWDVIQWERSCTLYTMAVTYQDNPPSLKEKSEEEVQRELLDLFTKALQSCDLEKDEIRLCMYQFRVALLHERLASLYHHMYRSKQDDAKRKHALRLANFHFEKSFHLMTLVDHPIDFLVLQMKRVGLQEFIAESSNTGVKLKALQTALEYLLKCESIFKSMSENQEELLISDQEEDKESLLVLYQVRLQFILKSLVKVTMSNSNPRVSCLTEKYKEMYGISLKANPGSDMASHLNIVLTILKSL